MEITDEGDRMGKMHCRIYTESEIKRMVNVLQGYALTLLLLYVQAERNVIQYRSSGTAWTEMVYYQRFNLKVVLF